jgi:hypothetical protein
LQWALARALALSFLNFAERQKSTQDLLYRDSHRRELCERSCVYDGRWSAARS